jgi:hypothetical protein
LRGAIRVALKNIEHNIAVAGHAKSNPVAPILIDMPPDQILDT